MAVTARVNNRYILDRTGTGFAFVSDEMPVYTYTSNHLPIEIVTIPSPRGCIESPSISVIVPKLYVVYRRVSSRLVSKSQQPRTLTYSILGLAYDTRFIVM